MFLFSLSHHIIIIILVMLFSATNNIMANLIYFTICKTMARVERATKLSLMDIEVDMMKHITGDTL
jgi:hypothetical protein